MRPASAVQAFSGRSRNRTFKSNVNSEHVWLANDLVWDKPAVSRAVSLYRLSPLDLPLACGSSDEVRLGHRRQASNGNALQRQRLSRRATRELALCVLLTAKVGEDPAESRTQTSSAPSLDAFLDAYWTQLGLKWKPMTLATQGYFGTGTWMAPLVGEAWAKLGAQISRAGSRTLQSKRGRGGQPDDGNSPLRLVGYVK
jgi:hypothetical protein